MEYRFLLEPYKNLNSRHLCPRCGKKELTLYIDKEKATSINPNVGRCNRETNCGYNYTPKQYFIDNNLLSDIPKQINTRTIPLKTIPKEASYIEAGIFKQSLTNYENNNFIQFLIAKFGEEIAIEIIEKYYIGTSKKWEGATVFYQIDTKGKIRTAKIMLYNPSTGKRIKEPYDHITWLHSLLKLANFNLSQSLFGLHLTKDWTKTIAVVESEKTAIIASLYLPQYIWLATGGKQNLKAELFTNLQNRNVVFFPDLKCYDLWTEKAKTLGLKNYTISDLLESNANEIEKAQGLDIADYLLKYDYLQWRLKELIEFQWQKFNPKNWDLNNEYDLQVSCEWIQANYKVNVTPEIYYDVYKKLY